MDVIAFVFGIFGLFGFLVALKARGELELLRERVERLAASDGGDTEELERDVRVNRAFLARLAAGEHLEPDQIAEGQVWSDVNVERAKALLDEGVRVLDVRTPQETAGGVIPGAIRIPVDELPNRVHELGRKGDAMLVYCAAGVRSAAACEFLSDRGFTTLHNLDTGMMGWSGPLDRPA